MTKGLTNVHPSPRKLPLYFQANSLPSKAVNNSLVLSKSFISLKTPEDLPAGTRVTDGPLFPTWPDKKTPFQQDLSSNHK